jgi:predicted Zn-dependent protease
VKYLKAAGYDAKGLARIIERMQSGSQLRTHPPTPQRVAKIKSLAANTPGATNKERFASNLKK